MSALARQYYEFGPFTLDQTQRVLLRAEKVVPLTPKVFETLLVLVENTGLVVTKDDLLSKVWPDTIVEEQCVSQNIFLLRKALGEDSKGHHYIETIPKVGYRFLPNISEHQDFSGALMVERRDRFRILATEEQTNTRDDELALKTLKPGTLARFIRANGVVSLPGRLVLLLLCLVTASVASAYYFGLAGKAASTAVEIKSIAVLPFKPLGADPNDEYLGLGMADTLIGQLSHLSQVRVRPTSAVRKYVSRDVDALAAGREQRVDAVLEASLHRSGERLRLSVQLVSVRDGASLWSYKCDEQRKDLFAVQDSIAQRVAEALAVRLTGDERRLLTKHYTESTEAYQLYQTGRFFWNKRTVDGFKKALEYFNQAVEKDAGYALPHVGLADCYGSLNALTHSLQNAHFVASSLAVRTG